MKGTHQIYLFAATLAVAIAYFVWRGLDRSSQLYEIEPAPVSWTTHDFGEALFGGDSLNFQHLQAEFQPFLQSQPQRFFWEHERENEYLQNHYTNVAALMDHEAIAEQLAGISGRAKSAFGVNTAEDLYFYISGIDLETPCLYVAPQEGEPAYAFVGLDNFLGPAYPGYEGIPTYQRTLLRPEQLPVAFAHALLEGVVTMNYANPSLLEAALFHGKRALATTSLTPETPEHEVLGYTAEEWAFLESNERNIWEVFVREKFLFSTDIILQQRLVEPAPFSKLGTALDTEIPPRVARYLGYKLIRSYAQSHNQLTLQQIINLRDAQKILRDAKYKP